MTSLLLSVMLAALLGWIWMVIHMRNKKRHRNNNAIAAADTSNVPHSEIHPSKPAAHAASDGGMADGGGFDGGGGGGGE